MSFDTDGAVAPDAGTLAPAADTTAPNEQPIDLDTQETAAPDESPPSGETEGTEPASLPPIELPKSWNADHKDKFAALPRETQEYLAERETARDAEVRRAQNEAAENTKSLTAKEQAAEQSRLSFEHALGEAAAIIEQRDKEFADIKTPQDVSNLADQDPFRFTKWQAHRMQVESLQNAARYHHETRQREQQAEFTTWADKQDQTFSERNREFSDPKKASELRDTVIVPYLTETLGVTRGDMDALRQNPIIRDAKMQQALYDAARFHAAKIAAKAAVPKAAPAPQKPGTAAGKGDATDLRALAEKGDMAAFIAARNKGAT